jgi:hypothetical protein
MTQFDYPEATRAGHVRQGSRLIDWPGCLWMRRLLWSSPSLAATLISANLGGTNAP